MLTHPEVSAVFTDHHQQPSTQGLVPTLIVAESLLDRLIDTSDQVLMDDPSYPSRKRPGTNHQSRYPHHQQLTTWGNYVTTALGIRCLSTQTPPNRARSAGWATDSTP